MTVIWLILIGVGVLAGALFGWGLSCNPRARGEMIDLTPPPQAAQADDEHRPSFGI